VERHGVWLELRLVIWDVMEAVIKETVVKERELNPGEDPTI
jgi:hypothetical protein